ncbi:hypothetical protein [Pedobacter mucosus]|uniref:hypothetical protein n=1 Tax=Pedobacter mucosus TaxID=2895286 RepID=UPI001EE3CBC1|nr:hypothetical protein [Pedobacter mucosus]UKT63263.1 hypothetical protein LOK61_16015 [Pedobacter mucosus]
MKGKFIYLLIIFASFTLPACKEKLACNNPIALKIVEGNVKSDYIEAWALSMAAEAYVEENFKFKYDWFGNMNKNYKAYLVRNVNHIKNKEGDFYKEAFERYQTYDIKLKDIITEGYEESTEKCSCTASFRPANTNVTNSISYYILKNIEGKLSVRYQFIPKALIDDKTNASEFIRQNSST